MYFIVLNHKMSPSYKVLLELCEDVSSTSFRHIRTSSSCILDVYDIVIRLLTYYALINVLLCYYGSMIFLNFTSLSYK